MIPPYNSKSRTAFHIRGIPRNNIVNALRSEVHRNPGRGERVLLSFTTDPYQPADVEFGVTKQVIQVLHNGGYAVQVLTKGGTRALRDLELFTTRDAFAITMTFLDDTRSLEWEPGAALPSDRLEALQCFHAAGVPTWISLEPVIDPATSLQIIREAKSFVDLFKIGKLNHHPLANHIDWRSFGMQAVELCEQYAIDYYIKNDLATYFNEQPQGPHQVTVEQIEATNPTLDTPMQLGFNL